MNINADLQAALARIQAIEGRIETLDPPQNPALPSSDNSAAPFNVALAQASGQISLSPNSLLGTPALQSIIERNASLNGLDPALLNAVINAESGGNPQSISKAGAMGLMQLMPGEVRQYGVTDPFDPEQNVAAGAQHLAGLLQHYNGNLSLALAAYNAGVGAVAKYGGIPPYPETQSYVQRILSLLGQRQSN
ncbi:MAG: lytic transglycosylase domain-containing protein [Armatimonadetes bacterium]|nr:lytic transglycosylase domain-containing protein [Armatimonadota bacterium]